MESTARTRRTCGTLGWAALLTTSAAASCARPGQNPPVVGPAANAPANAAPWVDPAEIDRLVEAGMRLSGAPSYVVGIVSREGLVYAKAFGLADIGANRRATVETIYQVGSVTKTFTATLLCILIDEGTLSLDDPVAEYLPAGVCLPTDHHGAPAITLRHLATHTSGLLTNPINRKNVPGSPSVMMPYSLRNCTAD
jgi:CubicO group peptidase (beta-lactamase class C family)